MCFSVYCDASLDTRQEWIVGGIFILVSVCTIATATFPFSYMQIVLNHGKQNANTDPLVTSESFRFRFLYATYRTKCGLLVNKKEKEKRKKDDTLSFLHKVIKLCFRFAKYTLPGGLLLLLFAF